MYNLPRRDGAESAWTTACGGTVGLRWTERDAKEASLWSYVPFPLLEKLAREAAELSYLVSGLSK